jgi:hypothetical protein
MAWRLDQFASGAKALVLRNPRARLKPCPSQIWCVLNSISAVWEVVSSMIGSPTECRDPLGRLGAGCSLGVLGFAEDSTSSG